jgi:tripartite-type tricarboxylate transporter receptor subunit TctC
MSLKPFVRSQLFARVALVAWVLMTNPSALAQNTSPLRVIVTNSAGSGIDIAVRAVVPSLAKTLGRPVVIENLPGAGGITATSALIKSAPDGNTIALVSNNHAVNPTVYKKIPYDSLNDITPITVVGDTPFVLAVNPNKISAKSARELQSLLKSRPGAYNYGSSGNGTIIHLAAAMFADAADVDIKHIPYKGMNAMVADLIGGQTDLAAVAVPVAAPFLRAGTLRAIGVMGKQRVPSLPDVPTIAEQGFPDVDVAGWFAFIGPAKLPAAEVKRLYEGIVAAFNTAEGRDAMSKQENVIHPMSPEASAKFFRTEQERYAKLVKKVDVKLD